MKIFLIAIGLWVILNFTHNLFLFGEIYNLIHAFIALALFLEIDPKKLMYKYLSYLWMAFSFASVICEPIVECYSINDYYYYAGCFFMSLIGLFHILSRSYDMPSDDYTGEGLYLVFKKPKNAFGLSISMVFRTASSVSVVIDKDWYGYKKDVEGIHKDKYKKSEFDCIMKLNLNKHYRSHVANAMIGTPWTFRSNCCHFVQMLFIGQKFSPLDSIPCILLRKLERLKQDGAI